MATAAAAASDKAGSRITATLALSMLLASQGTSIANIALPALAEAFAAPLALVQGVVVAYLAALTASTLVAGRLGDVHGLRRMYLLGLWTFGAASLLCGLAPGLGWLIAARVLQGIGAAFLMTLALALMRETATPQHLGRAMGLLGTMSALGTAMGPTLGGLLLPAPAGGASSSSRSPSPSRRWSWHSRRCRATRAGRSGEQKASGRHSTGASCPTS